MSNRWMEFLKNLHYTAILKITRWESVKHTFQKMEKVNKFEGIQKIETAIMQPLFIATKPFGPGSDSKWQSYIKWSGLTQLLELISLDSTLCTPILSVIEEDYWPHILNEDFLLCYFTDLGFLLQKLDNSIDANILCTFRNPPEQPSPPTDRLEFSFLGYDLVEAMTGVSALTNCGGFPKSFSNDDLNKFGLLGTHKEAMEVQASFRKNYPDERHADCDFWAVFIANHAQRKRGEYPEER